LIIFFQDATFIYKELDYWLSALGAVLGKKYLTLIGHMVCVGVVKFSLLREIACDGHGRGVVVA